MPRYYAPAAGYRNCSRCTRWKPVSAFPIGRTRRSDGTPIEPPQMSAWCETCRRADCRRRNRERKEREAFRREWQRRRVLTRSRNLVERGQAVWAAPLQAWVAAQRADGMEVRELARMAEVDESNFQRAMRPDTLTVSIDFADRLLLAAGSGLGELYPYDDPHFGALAA